MSAWGSDEAIPFDQFVADARALDIAAFRARHGDGFLLLEAPLAVARRPQRPQPTIVINSKIGSQTPVNQPPSSAVAASPNKRFLVFPVKATGRSPYPRIIAVGRTKNNDVVIADIAISKFHAFFKEENGRFFVQDAGSRNGTFVDGAIAPDAKHGKPVPVNVGAKVRFGEVELTFANAERLRELALEPGGP